MHLLLGLLIVALLAYLAHRYFLASGAGAKAGAEPARQSEHGFAVLANGLLFTRERGAQITQLHSAYIQDAMDRRERVRERHSWKKGTSFGIAAGGNTRDIEPVGQPILATAAAYQANGDLLYCLKDETVGGLFRRDAASGQETRLLLRQGLHLGDLSLASDGKTVAASSHQSDGVANIALMDADGGNYRDLTGGDTVDSAPAWIPSAPNRLLFQSCGLARDEQGYVVALGQASIQKLDLDSRQLTPILEDAGFDHLKPRVSPAGDLLFIRRPFEAPRYGVNSILADTLFFPFRLLRAVFHYLNFFSLMYSRKPLTSASGTAVKADIKNILLQGRRIDAEKALRNAGAVHGVPSLVPESWQLVCRDPSGAERVLATHVASFDIGADGAVIYSNGRGVFVLEQDGVPRLAGTQDLVAEVFAPAA